MVSIRINDSPSSDFYEVLIPLDWFEATKEQIEEDDLALRYRNLEDGEYVVQLTQSKHAAELFKEVLIRAHNMDTEEVEDILSKET